jgi:hypothetical protein
MGPEFGRHAAEFACQRAGTRRGSRPGSRPGTRAGRRGPRAISRGRRWSRTRARACSASGSGMPPRGRVGAGGGGSGPGPPPSSALGPGGGPDGRNSIAGSRISTGIASKPNHKDTACILQIGPIAEAIPKADAGTTAIPTSRSQKCDRRRLRWPGARPSAPRQRPNASTQAICHMVREGYPASKSTCTRPRESALGSARVKPRRAARAPRRSG